MNNSKSFMMPISIDAAHAKIDMKQELSIEDDAVMSVSSENSSDVEDMKDLKEFSPVVEKHEQKRSGQHSKKMRKCLFLIKKQRKKKRIEHLISKAADYLESEEASVETINKKVLEEPTLKCGELNCKFAHVALASLTSLKLHQLLDHSDSLRKPSQHALFDVKVNENTDLIMRSFGPLIMKDGSKMIFEAPPNNIFCKLCMNDDGKIINLDNNKELLLLHVVKTHLEGENLHEELCARSDSLRYKFTKTKNGKKKITRGTHSLYCTNTKSLKSSSSNRVGFQRFFCFKDNKSHSKSPGFRIKKPNREVAKIKKFINSREIPN